MSELISEKTPKNIVFLLILAFIFLGACSQSTESNNPTSTESNNPTWVNELIMKFQNEPVGNPPQSIYRYEYNGQTVYYTPPQCCDIPSILYDSEGNEICLPTGGIDGRGDGRCPDFVQERTNETVIWSDSRTR